VSIWILGGQTETGNAHYLPMPSVPLKAGRAFRLFQASSQIVVDKDGKPVEVGKGGFLVIKNSWPAQLRLSSETQNAI